MTTAKNDIFIGLQLENFHLVGAGELTFAEGIKIWCWGGGFFSMGVSKFLNSLIIIINIFSDFARKVY